jgi:cystathionine beta-lyase/cystathionine gamma-synthase
MVFIETPENNRIVFDDNNKLIELSDQHGNKVTLDDKGITITSAKDLTLDASGKVVIKGSATDVQ